jgi:hypothetical protein
MGLEDEIGNLQSGQIRDRRCIKIQQPFITVGCELSLADLDLVVDVKKFYEAPIQVKTMTYGLLEYDIKPKRHLQASHLRDICEQIIDISRYFSTERIMRKELLGKAASAYFVEL